MKVLTTLRSPDTTFGRTGLKFLSLAVLSMGLYACGDGESASSGRKNINVIAAPKVDSGGSSGGSSSSAPACSVGGNTLNMKTDSSCQLTVSQADKFNVIRYTFGCRNKVITYGEQTFDTTDDELLIGSTPLKVTCRGGS